MSEKQQQKEIIYTFIDSQNLNLSIRDQGWKLDFAKLKIYLKEKYNVTESFVFLGYVPSNKSLYERLYKFGYRIIFKPISRSSDGKIKGNIDAELVLHSMIEYKNYNKAIIVTGDGDFHCLVEYLKNNHKLERLLIPNAKKYSDLLKKCARDKIDFMNPLKSKLEYK
ncbi:MAG: NYN domain-containing protein [Candidatus Peregrinibacteria bacterium]|nr:NYN domain-containing protein [Candidatus Peregrinibacteria bacterium]